MNFIISSNELLNSLQAVSRVIKSKNTQPIYDNFIFEVADNILKITAGDSESTLTSLHHLENCNGEGRIAIDAKRLIDIVKELAEQPITINVESGKVDIVTDNGKYSVVGSDADEFKVTEQKESDEDVTFDVATDLFLEGVNKAIFAVANDELRPVMNGVFIKVEDNQIRFVATDSHKLVRYTRKDVTIDSDGEFILPHKPASLLRNILPKESGDVKVVVNNSTASFKTEKYHLICSLIVGSYPNYSAVIPVDNPIKVVMDRLDLINSLKRVSACSNQSSHLVQLDFTPNSVEVSAKDIDFSIAGQETMPCRLDGSEITMGFKSVFLIEILNNIPTQDVVLELSDPARSGIVLPFEPENEDEDTLMLLMPMMT